jgi:ubiquinone/menaquinone biosynthesis C-methylase UbiE
VSQADGREIVRAGYNAIAARYLTTRSEDSEDVQLLDELVRRLPRGAAVLDAGCGAGVPVARFLSRFFDVTGIDFAKKQIEMARQLVPQARFRVQDMTNLDLPEGSFDAVCSYYAIIHVPRKEHRKMLEGFYRVLMPSGLALLCMGANDVEADFVDDYLGAPMFWSHYDAPTNLRMIAESGFEIVLAREVADSTFPSAKHLFVLARSLAHAPTT